MVSVAELAGQGRRRARVELASTPMIGIASACLETRNSGQWRGYRHYLYFCNVSMPINGDSAMMARRLTCQNKTGHH